MNGVPVGVGSSWQDPPPGRDTDGRGGGRGGTRRGGRRGRGRDRPVGAGWRERAPRSALRGDRTQQFLIRGLVARRDLVHRASLFRPAPEHTPPNAIAPTLIYDIHHMRQP